MSERPLDLAVTGGTVVGPHGRRRVDLGVRDGCVVARVAPGTLGPALATCDANGMLVLPGIVDTHFHCRAPERPDREDFDSGTAAAAAGGVTTLVEMPISDPVCSTPEVLAARMDLARRQARIDVGLHVAVGDLDRPRLQEMVDAGAVAFKAMMHAAPPGREASFRGLAIPDDGTLYRALEAVAETGRVLMVHAEHQELIDLFERRERVAGQHDGMAHARSRPVVAEASAVARIASMNEAVGARLHIVHLSSARAAEYVAWFRGRGQTITAETTPAYLFADLGDVERHGPFVKVNPPLRSRADGEALMGALKRGVLDTIASDHAPFRGSEKEAAREDIWAAGSGIPSVELTGPLLWDAALRGVCTFEQAVAWASAQPASLFELHAAKGHLDVGADADFVLVDPDAETEVRRDRLHSRSADAMRHVLGRRLRGRIGSVWSRGRIAFDGERVRADPGDGAVIRPVTGPDVASTPDAASNAAAVRL